MKTGDKTRIKKVRTAGFLTEDYTYDSESRVNEYKQTVDYRESYPMTTSYVYDTLDRVEEVHYPAQYGLSGNPRKIVAHTYDTASRLTQMTYGGAVQASDVVLNASGQTTEIKIGAAGTNQVTEQYTFDQQTGLLTNQQAIRQDVSGTSTLLNLDYNYQRNNSVGNINGKTGNLTKIVNNLDNAKNREYEFDALGRLTKAKGGATGTLWNQNYTYDRFGNRTNVVANGVAANSTPIPLDGLPNLVYDATSNRITTTGFDYDVAGNQIKAPDALGNGLLFEYDAANRLQIIKKESDGSPIQSFQYGAKNTRLMSFDNLTSLLTIYAAEEGSVLAEYIEFTHTIPAWTKNYTYLGENLLSTSTPDGNGGESVEFHHPDRLGSRIISNPLLGSSYEQTNLPFGNSLNAESTGASNVRFTSYDRSQTTELDYALNRTYDSKQGRFTQIDPIGIDSVDLRRPQSLNLYTYCENDPINSTDAEGLFLGKLFKWIGKIFKAILIAVAVFIAVVAIIVMPALAPIIGYAFFAKLFVLSGLLLVQALAPPKIALIAGLATGILLNFISFAKFGVILNTADSANKISKWQRILGVLVAVGSVSDSLSKNYRGNGKQYKTAQEAAVAFLKIYNPRSIRINKEIAAFICKLKNGKFIYAKPQEVGSHGGQLRNNCPSNSQLAGGAHAHARHDASLVSPSGADGNEMFSGVDAGKVFSSQTPEWIATPSGDIHRLNPDGSLATVSKLKGIGRTKRQ